MLSIRPLQSDDIPAAVQLSTQANWNHTEIDWQRLLALQPETCLAGTIDNQLVATGMLAPYSSPPPELPIPTLGWLGMLLVHPQHRRQGHGRAMMAALLDLAAQRKIPTLAVDATELARPLLRKLEFVDHCAVHRYLGRPHLPPTSSQSPRTHVIKKSDWAAIAKFDQGLTGVDRLALLKHLAGEPNVKTAILSEGERVHAYAMARPGRVAWTIGPVVADSLVTASTVFHSLLAQLLSASRTIQVMIDVPSPSPLERIIVSHHLTIAQRSTRMSSPAATMPLLRSPAVFAATALELG